MNDMRVCFGLGVLLVSLALSLQGCENKFAGEGGDENYCAELQIRGGKIPMAAVGPVTDRIECIAGLKYQGPEIECLDAFKKCKYINKAGKTECATSKGFKRSDKFIPDSFPLKDYGADVNAKSAAYRDAFQTTLVADPKVQCDNKPASAYKEWSELTPEEQAAAKVLGHTATKWNNDAAVPADKKAWSELSQEEQQAATTLGWTQGVWDSSEDEDIVQIEDKFAMKKVGQLTSPMGVSFIVSMCLLIAVSLRAVAQLSKHPQAPIANSHSLTRARAFMGGWRERQLVDNSEHVELASDSEYVQ